MSLIGRVLGVARPALLRTALAPRVAAPAASRWLSSDTFLNVDEVTERVITVVKAFDKVDESKVSDVSKFAEDLGLDSLDTVEVVMAFEEEFVIEIPDAEAEKITSCEQAIAFISAHPQAK